VTQDDHPSFFAGQFGDFVSDPFADSSQTSFAAGLFSLGMRETSAFRKSAFRDHNNAEVLAAILAVADGLTNALDVVRNLGNQDDISAPGNTGMDGNPSGVAPHDFDDQHTPMAFRCCVQLVERVARRVDRCVKAERDNGNTDVVVDRFGNSDERNAFFEELLGNPERTVTADDDQGTEFEFAEVLNDLVGDVPLDSPAVLGYGVFEGIARVGGPKNGAAEVKNARNIRGG